VDDELVVVKGRQSLTAGVEAAAFGQGDQLLYLGLDRLRLGLLVLIRSCSISCFERLASNASRCEAFRLSLLRFLR
jgi:hypothetical protein